MDFGMNDKDQTKIAYCRNRIAAALKDYPNFNGINLTDVAANGIQLSGNHKQISGYIYPSYQITIAYDFSNLETAIEQFVSNWKDCDNSNDVADAKLSYSQMSVYGYD